MPKKTTKHGAFADSCHFVSCRDTRLKHQIDAHDLDHPRAKVFTELYLGPCTYTKNRKHPHKQNSPIECDLCKGHVFEGVVVRGSPTEKNNILSHKTKANPAKLNGVFVPQLAMFRVSSYEYGFSFARWWASRRNGSESLA